MKQQPELNTFFMTRTHIAADMRSKLLPLLPFLVIGSFQCGNLFSQNIIKTQPAPTHIEPGLETAILWKWWVVPSEQKDWGLPLPELPPPKLPTTSVPAPGAPDAVRPTSYEVKKGDALILIAKKFGMKPDQLKAFNELKDSRIIIGQELRIPTLAELQALALPSVPEKQPETKKKKVPDAPKQELGFDALRERENVQLQVFLDREQFSPGPIDGKPNPTFLKIYQIYQNSHPEVKDSEAFKTKAQSVRSDPFIHYKLRAEDFRFIQLPKIEKTVAKGKTKQNAPAAPPAVTYDELAAATFLGYLSPWEFVAERFHCDEAFLRRVNRNLKGTPTVDAEFLVPDVIPFEIENALEMPLQPAADPQKPVTAAVVELTRLEISQEGKVVAVMPIASARPGLHGKGSWKILDAIPRPRLATKREIKETPKQKSANLLEPIPTATPVVEPPLVKEQYLAPGPNNPVGIVWLNLAKASDTELLPYGLHGTSIPGQMNTQHGIGGFRLANWDIARAVRLLPAGTPLQWKQR